MDQLAHYWLATLCRQVPGVTGGVLFHAPDKGECVPSAFWPEQRTDLANLADWAGTVFAEGQGRVVREKDTAEEGGEARNLVACPLLKGQPKHQGVVVLRMSDQIPAKQQAVMQQIEAAAIWYEALAKQRSFIGKNQLVTIVELVASCLEHERLQAAATEVVTDLAARLACDRISIGFVRGHGVAIEAISHSAGFDRRSDLVRAIGEAMHEAMEQNCTILFPDKSDSMLLTRCHATISATHGVSAICTVPFAVNGAITGAVLAERPSSRPFDQAAVDQLSHIVSMIGPVLEVRRRDEQNLLQRFRGWLRRGLTRFFGPGHVTAKLGLALAVLATCVLLLVSGEYRITCDARLEAETQQAVVASQDGFVATADARPGDVVHAGDLLGTLEDRDLRLEHRKWSSQLEQLRAEYRDALASHDRSKVSIFSAKMLQAEAQMHLVGEKLRRIQLIAPFDGLVVSGDLSQSLGSPVQRGQVLFTVAPLEAYRVMLKVDERDIISVREGLSGQLVVSSMPRNPLGFIVKKITPVSQAVEGRNHFLVEAALENNSDLFRPGMEGVAKIFVGQRRLIWIWGHDLADWLRLTLWSLKS